MSLTAGLRRRNWRRFTNSLERFFFKNGTIGIYGTYECFSIGPISPIRLIRPIGPEPKMRTLLIGVLMTAAISVAEPPPAKPADGRSNLPAIGINLARQGYVVFAYDMAGYNDTNQVEHRKFANSLRPWLWNASLLGLQLWDSIRAVDYLLSRPDI